MNKRKNANKGFALIELLVVVLIIGILAAIALPQYKMSVYSTRYTELITNVTKLQDAAERYYMVYNKYPGSFNVLDVEFPGTITYEENGDNLSYRYYNNFPNKGYNLHVNNCGSWYSVNEYNGYGIVSSSCNSVDAGKHYCVARADNKTAQKVCMNNTHKTTYDRTGSSNSESSWGKLIGSKYIYYYE